MTLEHLLAREAIRDTLSRYNTSGDRLKVDDYAACFTADGIMEAKGFRPEQAFRYETRETIRAWQSRWLERTLAGEKVHQASFARHHLSTCTIDITGPTSARALTYWVAWTDIGPDHAGTYTDEFRKEGERWLIAHRKVRLDWEAENSLFRTAVTNSGVTNSGE